MPSICQSSSSLNLLKLIVSVSTFAGEASSFAIATSALATSMSLVSSMIATIRYESDGQRSSAYRNTGTLQAIAVAPTTAANTKRDHRVIGSSLISLTQKRKCVPAPCLPTAIHPTPTSHVRCLARQPMLLVFRLWLQYRVLRCPARPKWCRPP